MRAGIFIPMIDLAFLALAAVVAILSQTQLVHSLPVEVTEIKPGVAAVSKDDVTIIAITSSGYFVEDRPVALDEIGGAVDGKLALLRVGHAVPTEMLVQVMAELAAEQVEIRIEVEQRSSGGPQ